MDPIKAALVVFIMLVVVIVLNILIFNLVKRGSGTTHIEVMTRAVRAAVQKPKSQSEMEELSQRVAELRQSPGASDETPTSPSQSEPK
jgi:hypothetical protein